MKLRDPSGAEHQEVIPRGEFLIVPHGTEHLPYAQEETHMMLLQPNSTLNTGNVRNQRTVPHLQSI